MPFLDLDDVRLEYDVTGSGPPLVFMHGLSGCLELDRPLAEALGAHFRVLWYSSRGHGRSSAPRRGSGWGYGQFARDLDRLVERVGFELPFLVGASHGANTVLRHAVEFPGRAGAAVILAPGGNALTRPGLLRFTAMRAAAWANRRRHGDDWLVRMLTNRSSTDPTQDRELIAAAATHDLARLSRAMRRIPDQAAVEPALLNGNDLRCVVAAWDGDPVVHPLATACHVAALLPNARFVQVRRLIDDPAEAQVRHAVCLVKGWYSELAASGA